MSLFKKIKWLVHLLLFNRAARLSFTLVCGVVINIAYILINIFSAAAYRSIWSATVSIYHLILIIIRIYLLSARGASKKGLNSDRLLFRVGVLLLFLDLVMASMMVYTVRQASFASYSGVVLFAFLFYALYSLIISVKTIKNRVNDNNHLQFAAKNISLSTALMSVFNLQYSLFSFLGADDILIGRVVLVGGVSVFSVILFLSVRLIKKAKLWADN